MTTERPNFRYKQSKLYMDTTLLILIDYNPLSLHFYNELTQRKKIIGIIGIRDKVWCKRAYNNIAL